MCQGWEVHPDLIETHFYFHTSLISSLGKPGGCYWQKSPTESSCGRPTNRNNFHCISSFAFKITSTVSGETPLRAACGYLCSPQLEMSIFTTINNDDSPFPSPKIQEEQIFLLIINIGFFFFLNEWISIAFRSVLYWQLYRSPWKQKR